MRLQSVARSAKSPALRVTEPSATALLVSRRQNRPVMTSPWRPAMPGKIDIRVSEVWWENSQAVVKAAIDTLNGLTSQINNHQINGEYDCEDLLDRIEGQLRDLRRCLEAVAVPF